MEKICDLNKCSGCGACVSSCPLNCIELKIGYEGFLYPNIDNTKCVNCKKCEKICPANNLKENKGMPLNVLAVQIKDKEVLKRSSSGGAFASLAIPILEKGGIVFGCTMDEKLNVYHTMISSVSDLDKLHGSKYIQSDTRNIYAEVIKQLEKEKKVLFVGTPCQVAGLYAVCENKEYSNLITVDLVCHGVSSQYFFNKHIKNKEEINNCTINKIEFRSKDKKANQYLIKYHFVNDTVEYKKAFDDEYLSCFMHHANYRESCYTCKFASIPRISDFTIGDFVGVNEKVVNKNIKQQGISVMLLNTRKAELYFQEIKNTVYYWERPLEEATSSNLCLIQPSKRPSFRDDFLKNIEKNNISDLYNKFCKLSFKSRVALFIGAERIRKIKMIFKGKELLI